MPATLQIDIPNIGSLIQTYNVLRLERSDNQVLGPFIEITAASATAAVLTGIATATSFNVSGLTLQVSINGGTSTTTTFTGSNPIALSSIISQLNATIGFSAASNVSNTLRLTSNTTGTNSSIQITGGTAVSILGFTINQLDIGEDVYIPLVANQTSYQYTDFAGNGNTYYRYRPFSTTATTSPFGSYSSVFQGVASTPLAASSIVTCSVTLLDLKGIPVPNQEISFYSLSPSLIVSNSNVGSANQTTTLKTDSTGLGQIDLVVGQTLRVVFVGTSFVREFVVPSSDFDLMTLLSTSTDLFDVQQPVIPAALRRTL